MILRWSLREGATHVSIICFLSFALASSLSTQHPSVFQQDLQSLERPTVGNNFEETNTHERPSNVANAVHQTPLQPAEGVFSDHDGTGSDLPDISSYSALLDALDVMQSHYYSIWPGTWTTAIDWTAAVMGTQVSATLIAITDLLKQDSKAAPSVTCNDNPETQRRENTINQYFTQITSFYHAENAFSLRTQAYDDMLWVVLGWLESIKFIHHHSELYQPTSSPQDQQATTEGINTSTWYAQQFIPQFAHRARIFYDLAAKGWDTSLCNGGMIWNPYLAPYKNAITNQLFITASINMYLYFPGDDNPSPFPFDLAKAHDNHYLAAAITAYDWLKSSNMTNTLGLYTDGFHISALSNPNSSLEDRKCDLRDEQVYTYNQGVILSGLRGLYTATANRSYLEDGHQLIRNVIAASGWDSEDRHRWRGLGRGGVMEEACDASGSCSQNGQTFKGIWWLHFTVFCQPIQAGEAAVLHRASCQGYGDWVRWNAKAAWVTRDREGRFGEWWGGHRWGPEAVGGQGTDYRNEGVPRDELWRGVGGRGEADGREAGGREGGVRDGGGMDGPKGTENSQVNSSPSYHDQATYPPPSSSPPQKTETDPDPNTRGRGRTVETQSGGLAVVRALYRWEMWYD
ncbi:MAG: hypothetical protein Q9195_008375 [Heterodermia aff. obscurata]